MLIFLVIFLYTLSCMRTTGEQTDGLAVSRQGFANKAQHFIAEGRAGEREFFLFILNLFSFILARSIGRFVQLYCVSK